MDIAFINRMLGMTRGGGEIWDLKTAEQLEKFGHEVTFYLGKPLKSDLSDPVEAFESVTIRTPYLRDKAYAAPKGIGGALYNLDTWLFRRQAAKALQNASHDIVHVNSDPPFGKYVSSFDQPVVIKMNGPPHSLWHDILNPVSSSYDFFEAFDAVIATGVTTEAIETRTGIDVHIINPGVDTEVFTPTQENTQGKTVLFVGRFVPAKNLPRLLQAFDQVRARHPEADLILVGDGPERHLVESLIVELNLRDVVSLPGYVDNSELPEYYRRADVFVLSSRQENHPITLMEAMSCGTPVVAPRIGWIPNMIDHGEEGLLFDNIEELINCLDQILSDPDLAARYGKRGQTKAVERLDWKQKAIKLEEIYQNIYFN